MVALPAVASGLLNVLGPLRLHRFGAGAAAIGAVFLVAAVAEGTISPLLGRVSDRRGRLVPLRFGLLAATGLMLCFTLPRSAALLGVVMVAVSAALGAFWAPAMAMLSDAAEVRSLDQGLAAALINLAWAGGQIAGSGVGGALAKAAGDGVPIAALVAMCAATLGVLVLRPGIAGAA